MAVIADDDIIVRFRVEADELQQAEKKIERLADNSVIDLTVNSKAIEKAIKSAIAKGPPKIVLEADTTKVDKALSNNKGFRAFIKNSLALISNFKGVQETIEEGTKLFEKYDETLLDLAKAIDRPKKEAEALAQAILKIKTRTQVDDLLSLGIAAGKLGIDFDKIPGFVKAADEVFVALGDNIKGSAEEIAIDLGKIANTFGLLEDNTPEVALRKVASVINDLDNIVGSADLDNVVKFTKSFAGVAAQADLTAAEVLTLGAVIDDANVSVDVASTALTNLIPAIAANKKGFADLAGISEEAFDNLSSFEQLDAVLKSVVSAEGGIDGLNESLERLGVRGRAGGVLVALANNADKLKPAVEEANKSFLEFSSIGIEAVKKNTQSVNAVTEIATKRYQTLLLGVNRVTGVFKKFNLTGKLTRGVLRGIGAAARTSKNLLLAVGAAALAAGAAALATNQETIDGLTRVKNQASKLATSAVGSVVSFTKSLFSGKGIIDSYNDATENFAENMNKASIQADKLTAAQIALRKANINAAETQATYNKRIDEQNQLVEQTNIGFTARVNALNEIIRLNQLRINDQIRINKLNITQLELDDENDAGKKALSEATAKQIDLEMQLARVGFEGQQQIIEATEEHILEIQALSDAYLALQRDIQIALSDDPLKNLTLTAIKSVEDLNRQRRDQLTQLATRGLDQDEINQATKKINQQFDDQIKVIQKNLETSISGLNNGISSGSQISLLEKFILGDGDIEDILPGQQFGALVQRLDLIGQKIGEIGDVDSVTELKLKEKLEAELNEIVQLLESGDLPKDIKRKLAIILGSDLKIIIPENEVPFLQGLLGLSDEDFEVFKEQLNDIKDATFQFFQDIEQLRIESLDKQIDIQEERIKKLLDNQEGFGAEQVALEEARLTDLTTKREEAARRQAEIAQIEAAANTLIGLSNAIAQPFPLNLAAFPLVLALITQLGGALNLIPGLFDGTEYDVARTIGKPNIKGASKDQYLVRVDGQEKIPSVADSKRVSHLSTKKMVDYALAHENNLRSDRTEPTHRMGYDPNFHKKFRPMNYSIPKATIERSRSMQDNSELVSYNKKLVNLNEGLRDDMQLLTKAVNSLEISSTVSPKGIYAMIKKQMKIRESRDKKFMRR